MKHNKLLTNLIVFAILLTVGFGCKSLNIPSLGGGGSGVNESTNPKDAITSAFKKFMDAKFYHSSVKSKNAQAEVVTELDYNAPDKFWIKNNIANMKSEVIVAGNDSYMRMNEGKWSKMPTGPKLADMRGKITDEAFAAMKDFELIGKENLNGKDTIAYKFNSTYGGESSSKMWISVDTGLPLKVDTNGIYGGTSVTLSIIYDYEKETKIEVPQVN